MVHSSLQFPPRSYFLHKSAFAFFASLLENLELILLLVASEDDVTVPPARPQAPEIRANQVHLPFFNADVFISNNFLDFLQKMYSEFSFTSVALLNRFLGRFVDNSRVTETVRRLQTELDQKNQISRLISLRECDKWALLASGECVLDQIVAFNEPPTGRDQKMHRALVYARRFVAQFSSCMEHAQLFHLLRKTESDWVDRIVHSFCHLVVVQVLLEKRFSREQPVSSYVQLVQKDLREAQSDFLKKLDKRVQPLLKRCSRLVQNVFQAKNLHFCTRLLIKIQRTLFALKARAQSPISSDSADVICLFDTDGSDLSSLFSDKTNELTNLLEAGFQLAMGASPSQSIKKPDMDCFFRAYHEYLAGFVARNAKKKKYRVDLARILILLGNLHSQDDQSPFAEMTNSVKEFLHSSLTGAESGCLDTLDRLFSLFSTVESKRIQAAARLFNHSSLIKKDYFASFWDSKTNTKTRLAEYEILLDLHCSKQRQIDDALEPRIYTHSDIQQIRDLADISSNPNVEMSVRAEAVEQVADVFLNVMHVPGDSFQRALSSIFATLWEFLVTEVSESRLADEFMSEDEQTWLVNVLQILLMYVVSQRTLFVEHPIFVGSVQKAKGRGRFSLTRRPRRQKGSRTGIPIQLETTATDTQLCRFILLGVPTLPGDSFRDSLHGATESSGHAPTPRHLSRLSDSFSFRFLSRPPERARFAGWFSSRTRTGLFGTQSGSVGEIL